MILKFLRMSVVSTENVYFYKYYTDTIQILNDHIICKTIKWKHYLLYNSSCYLPFYPIHKKEISQYIMCSVFNIESIRRNYAKKLKPHSSTSGTTRETYFTSKLEQIPHYVHRNKNIISYLNLTNIKIALKIFEAKFYL